MKSVIASLVAVAGLSVAASANIVNTQISFLVSVDGGAFGSSVDILAGTGTHTVEVVARMTYVGPGQTAGFASAVFQPTVSNWGATDAALGYVNGGAGANSTTPSGAVSDSPGQYGRISPFARSSLSTVNALTNHIHNSSAGSPAGRWLRIAQRTATGWMGGNGNTTGGQGVPVAQLANVGRTPSDPAFLPGSSVNVFRWGMNIDSGPAAGPARTLTIDAPEAGFGNRVTATSTSFPGSAIGDREFYWWGDVNASTGDLRGLAVVSQGFVNVIVPTPASLALLGLGGLCVARRRR